MYFLENKKSFDELFESLELNNWNIENQLFKDRASFYAKKDFFTKMRNKFLSENLTIWDLKSEEIVSWIDTFVILNRVLTKEFINENNIELAVIKEYPLVYGNHMRVDYLIVFERAIIVLEMGMFNQDEKRGEERYTKKLLESIAYKQLIENMVNGSIEVFNHVIIYRPEYDRFKNVWLRNNIIYNNGEVKTTQNYISKIVKSQINNRAINQLDLLEKEREKF